MFLTYGGPHTIVDKVSFEGLKPNQHYRVSGWLMDKETNQPLLVNGEMVTGSLVFKAGDYATETEGELVSGFVNVEFTIQDTTQLAGKDVVVFEELQRVLLDENGDVIESSVETIAEHKDINDAGQTVRFEYPPTKPQLPNTGEFDGIYVAVAFLMASIVFAFVYRKQEEM